MEICQQKGLNLASSQSTCLRSGILASLAICFVLLGGEQVDSAPPLPAKTPEAKSNQKVETLANDLMKDIEWRCGFPPALKPWPVKGADSDALVEHIRKQAEDKQDPRAQNLLGVMYHRGAGVTQSNEKALEYFRLAVQKTPDAANRWNLAIVDGYSAKEIAQVYEEMRKNDLPEALMFEAYFLEQAYKKQISRSQENSAKAKKAGEKLVSLCHRAKALPLARYRLAELYRHGLFSVPRDNERAEPLYRELAEQGFGVAQTGLAIILLRAKKNDEAVSWFKKAIALEEPEAMAWLGMAQITGMFVPADAEKGLALLKKSAEMENYRGECWYGKALLYGWGGVAKDEKLGRAFLQKSIVHGTISEGEYSLGLIYILGIGGPTDRRGGMQLIQSAADAGHVDAIDYLQFVRKSRDEAARADAELAKLREMWKIEDQVNRDMERIRLRGYR